MGNRVGQSHDESSRRSEKEGHGAAGLFVLDTRRRDGPNTDGTPTQRSSLLRLCFSVSESALAINNQFVGPDQQINPTLLPEEQS
ncbi:unnamed protein product [Boreogadus saida]